MASLINYVDATLWFAALAVWGLFNKKLMAWIEARIARPMFKTDPKKTARYLYGAVACLLLYLSLSNVLAAKRQGIFESVAENMTVNQTEGDIRDPK